MSFLRFAGQGCNRLQRCESLRHLRMSLNRGAARRRAAGAGGWNGCWFSPGSPRRDRLLATRLRSCASHRRPRGAGNPSPSSSRSGRCGERRRLSVLFVPGHSMDLAVDGWHRRRVGRARGLVRRLRSSRSTFHCGTTTFNARQRSETRGGESVRNDFGRCRARRGGRHQDLPASSTTRL
jgi:hypothetical protein